jgi:hypothetical protein
MKTHVTSVVLWLAAFVLVAHNWKACDDGLNDEVIDFAFELLNVDSLGFNLFHDTKERPFMANTHVGGVVVEYKFRIFLVYGVIGQMHVLFFKITG